MTAENWHEERDRLIQLLQGIESGRITHIDEDDLRQLQATTPENIAVLKDRLATLNARLGDDKVKVSRHLRARKTAGPAKDRH